MRLRLQGVSWSTSLAHLRHELQRGSVVWTQHRLKKRIRLREGGGADAGKETRQWIWRSWPRCLCNMEVAKRLVLMAATGLVSMVTRVGRNRRLRMLALVTWHAQTASGREG